MKNLINTTLNDIIIEDLGITVAANSTYEINPIEYPMWARSSDVLIHIESGELIGNDGIRNLPIYLASMMLKHDIAENIGFNNTTNSFVATNVQSAIEEISILNDNNFSYRRIASGKIITIPEEQQMTVYQEIAIGTHAELVIRGELVIR
jgi:hypothetical protein